MVDKPLTIVQVNTYDIWGGAEKISYGLHTLYRQWGHHSYLVVRRKFSTDPYVIEIDNSGRRWGAGWIKVPFEKLFGWQYLHFPGSHRIPELIPEPIDLFHLHNLHGGYFDLGALPALARQTPTVVTLHDCWLFTGHCAYTLECERWRTGCGDCPDLSIPRAIPADGTRFNWQRKKRIMAESRLHITTPSLWLLDKVSAGILSHHPRRLVYNGVNCEIFQPGSKAKARAMLDLPDDASLVLFLASGGARNPFKDFSLLVEAFRLLLAQTGNRRLSLLVIGSLGDQDDPAGMGEQVIFREFVRDEVQVAKYYQAADILAYATKADNCPLTVIEAMACGLPVVASNIGGVSELIEEERTGLLVPPGNVSAFAAALQRLSKDPAWAATLGEKATEVARQRFDIRWQAKEYLALYEEVLR